MYIFIVFLLTSGKLVSTVADGPRDAVCPLKSYQLLRKTQLPQSECAMLHVTMNGRMRRPTKLHGECTARRRTVGASTVGGASCGEFY